MRSQMIATRRLVSSFSLLPSAASDSSTFLSITDRLAGSRYSTEIMRS